MTDIYVNRGKGNRWKWFLGGLVLILLLVGLRLRSGGKEDASPEPQTDGTATPVAQQDSDSPMEPTGSAELDVGPIQHLMTDGQWPKARETAFTALDRAGTTNQKREVERLLGEIHTAMIHNASPMEEKVYHVVKSGDTLGKLANRYGTTADSISARNGIENNLIRVGERLQILTGTFRVNVSKSLNEMEVYLNDRFFKRYRVGTGTDSSTPEGEYVITLRIRHPVWYRDNRQIPYGDPENLLGTHYLKLDIPGIGLHGTWEPESVGSQSSAGCVRLVNDDILELYHLLPEGTPVRITD